MYPRALKTVLSEQPGLQAAQRWQRIQKKLLAFVGPAVLWHLKLFSKKRSLGENNVRVIKTQSIQPERCKNVKNPTWFLALMPEFTTATEMTKRYISSRCECVCTFGKIDAHVIFLFGLLTLIHNRSQTQTIDGIFAWFHFVSLHHRPRNIGFRTAKEYVSLSTTKVFAALVESVVCIFY